MPMSPRSIVLPIASLTLWAAPHSALAQRSEPAGVAPFGVLIEAPNASPAPDSASRSLAAEVAAAGDPLSAPPNDSLECTQAKVGGAVLLGALGGAAGYALFSIFAIPAAVAGGDRDGYKPVGYIGAALGGSAGGLLGWLLASERPPCRWHAPRAR